MKPTADSASGGVGGLEAELTVDDLGFEAPHFSSDRIAEMARALFGISGDLRPLGGERDQNTRITDSQGRQFVVKVSGAAEDPATVDFQVKALLHVERQDPT
ncbi:MAG: hypothetical protein R3212_14580, partial [Xanthomonadales bacterium]|nr:hypothetical protein [Xanthomonadales bacterium]